MEGELKMIRLVGVTIPDDVDLFNGLRMIKGLETKHSRTKIENILTKAGLYTKQLKPSGKLAKVYPMVGDLSWKQKSLLIELLEIPRAKITNVRIGPKKFRLIADLIRGKSVDEALGILQFQPQAGAPVLLKLLKSAIANASNNHELRADKLFVAKVTIDGGPTMRRFMARARGRACRIRKRTSHALIVLRERFEMPKSEKKADKVIASEAIASKTTITAKSGKKADAPQSTTDTQGGKK